MTVSLPSQKIFPVKVSRLPSWLKQEIPDIQHINEMKSRFRESRLNTVCESAHCPNTGKCWGQGVATFMILGNICTRACRFCAIDAGRPTELDLAEPQNVADAVKQLGLRYVVITSVARDDLKDEGAGQFAQTIRAIREVMPQTRVEVLVPDFSNKLENLKTVVEANPAVISHNTETVRRLSPVIRPQADYDRSLAVLANYKKSAPHIFTKSSLMVGLGEKDAEIKEAMADLIAVGCDILTVGQYLAPSQMKRHLPVLEFVTPQKFKEYENIGYKTGFKHVMSGPLVRSSFIAEEGYNGCLEFLGKNSA